MRAMTMVGICLLVFFLLARSGHFGLAMLAVAAVFLVGLWRVYSIIRASREREAQQWEHVDRSPRRKK
ncbi:hypothetical protein [Chitinimonas sp.]|uniref:hypothetical protein n=1 Tax=Chitinimonas sp. TaxID=1934313 RepID=UPI0035B40FA8